MTKPTLTYGHKYLDDCDSLTGWSADHAHEDGQTATMTVLHGDIFNINVTVSAGNKICYYEYNLNDFDCNIYPYLGIRYTTSSSTIKAKVVAVYTIGPNKTVLAETDNTDWTVVFPTQTTGKIMDKIRIYANQDTGDVYFDFFLACRGIFTFPFVSELEQLTLENNLPVLDSPARLGQIPQYLGAKSPLILVSGLMDTNADWGTPKGKYLMWTWFQAHSDSWQWYTSDLIDCKVTPQKLIISKIRDRRQRVYDFFLKKYDLSSGDNESAGEYFGDSTWV